MKDVDVIVATYREADGKVTVIGTYETRTAAYAAIDEHKKNHPPSSWRFPYSVRDISRVDECVDD